MFIELVKGINNINSLILGWSNKYIEMLPAPDFVKDALIDSINLLPLLFIIFFIIEIFEIYFSKKINLIAEHSRKSGPLIGALTALIPQCGFSIIASTLYIKRLISKGTLLAVYISTSDEAIPVLLAHPNMFGQILPILGTKFILALLTGYAADFIFRTGETQHGETADIEETGCCSHEITNNAFKKRNLLIHPLKHTFNIFIFILIVTLILNGIMSQTEGHLEQIFLNNSPLQPVIAAIIGLIPNCAVSVLITMLYIEHAISFGSVIAGLSSSAGLGLIILLRKNTPQKDSLQIITILLAVSIAAGLILQTAL